MATDIIQAGDERLRKTAGEVPREDIRSERITRVIADMREALSREPHGVAIAAPQIGASLRLFVVSGNVFATRDESGQILAQAPDRVFINPVLIAKSDTTEPLEEGCLSVRGVQGLIERASTATVRALDEHGNEFSLAGDGLLAQIFQHEIDHLNGVLFTDTATRTWILPPNE